MSRYRLSAQARADLDDIWLYIASDNISAADRFIDALITKIQTLAIQPDLGRPRDELAKSLRSLPVGNYVIFYRSMQSVVEVVRVLSGFRDIPELFPDD